MPEVRRRQPSRADAAFCRGCSSASRPGQSPRSSTRWKRVRRRFLAPRRPVLPCGRSRCCSSPRRRGTMSGCPPPSSSCSPSSSSSNRDRGRLRGPADGARLARAVRHPRGDGVLQRLLDRAVDPRARKRAGKSTGSCATSSRRWRSRPACRPRRCTIPAAGMNASPPGGARKRRASPSRPLRPAFPGGTPGGDRARAAHIKSRDTLYNVCAAVLVGAVALLSDMFLRGPPGRFPGARGGGRGTPPSSSSRCCGVLARWRRRSQMSISRQREYHADAAAAGFTCNPLGLARPREDRPGAQVPGENRGTQHLFIVNPLRCSARTLRADVDASPTEERIQRLRLQASPPVHRRRA